MESDKSDELSNSELESIEQRVEQVEQQLSKMLPGRRGVLKGLGAAALGGAAVGGASGGASAQSAAGQVGTSSNPINVFGYDVDASSYTVDNDSALMSVAASGSVTLSSGTATVDTSISATGATFYLALGVDDPNTDAKIAGRLFWDDSAGSYKIEVVEDGTSIGNPTVNYDVLRVR